MQNNNFKLSVCNWNANGLNDNSRLMELSAFLKTNLVDVACITETRLSQNKFIFVPGYTIYRSDRQDRPGGGVAIFIRSPIRHRPIRSVTAPIESVGIEILQQNNRRPIKIISAYNPPSSKLLKGSLDALFVQNSPLIVAGDLNAKHLNWSCHSTNPNGRTLLSYSIRNDLTIEAPSSPTHFSSNENVTSDILDIFITKSIDSQIEIENCAALSSDHNPVILRMDLLKSIQQTAVKSVDQVFLRYILETFPPTCKPPQSKDDVDVAIHNLTQNISQAIDTASFSLPPKNQNPNDLPKPLLELIKKKNKTRKEWQMSRSPNLRVALNTSQRLIKQELTQIKAQSFNKWIETAESHPRAAWKVIKKLRNRKSQPPPLKKDGAIFQTDEEKASIFADTIQSQFLLNKSHIDHHDFHAHVLETVNHQEENPADLINPTSPAEIKSILNTLKTRKSPGSDGICNKFLKLLPRKHVVCLCNIINTMLRLKYFPDTWKQAIVVCIPKANKPLSDPCSYRPISLLNSISKVAETVILSRLSNFVNENNILPNSQFGFREKHGTIHQLLRVSEFIADKLNKRQHCSMLLLDVQQAFDRVWHEGLVYKLTQLKFPNYIIGITQSFLANRSFRVRVGKAISEPKSIQAGVPQGSKLSPMLFNIYSHDIPTNSRIMTALYADDIALIQSHPRIEFAAHCIAKFLPTLLNWYTKWRLGINHSKSEAMIFSRSKQNPIRLRIQQEPIEWKNSIKYLGIFFDRRVSWVKQIKHARAKSYLAFTSLKPFLNNRSISNHTKLRTVKAVIRPMLTYGLPIWGCSSSKSLKLLEGTQMRIIRHSLKIPWFIRNREILHDLSLTSLNDLAVEMATRLRLTISDHCNSEISQLVNYHPRSYDLVRRPSHLLED